MAETTFSLFLITFFLFLFTSSTSMAMADEDEELTLRDLNSVTYALRSNGYNLFANSIAVSDLSFQLLSTSSNSSFDAAYGGTHGGEDKEGRRGYTLFAPPNTALFSLDMSTDAFTYVNSLRVHVIPRRLTFSELRNVSRSSEPYLETLAPGHVIVVASSVLDGGVSVSVDDALISFPDMHLQPKIAVHGLDGILSSSAARVDDLGFVAAPQPFAGAFSPEISEVPSPVTSFASFTVGSEFGSVSIPPAGYFSSEISEIPMTTPAPTPACSDCKDENLSPYIWPPSSTINDIAEYINHDDDDFDQSLPPIMSYW